MAVLAGKVRHGPGGRPPVLRRQVPDERHDGGGYRLELVWLVWCGLFRVFLVSADGTRTRSKAGVGLGWQLFCVLHCIGLLVVLEQINRCNTNFTLA